MKAKVMCPRCDGSGIVEVVEHEEGACDGLTCEGLGDCFDCDGSGMAPVQDVNTGGRL